jgi:dephospho-CoA kinase
MVDDHLVGLVGWQVENLVARSTDLYLDPRIPAKSALPALLAEVERASRDLQCEASLVFVSEGLANQQSLWKGLGYDLRSPQTLKIQAWQEAALESMPEGSELLFKQLRTDRVLRPI